MSDLLTHWAVFDDCCRLSQIDSQMDPMLAKLMIQEGELARLGALSRSGAFFVPRILQLARDAWGVQDDQQRLAQKLAYALGAIAHYAADKVMKPLMNRHTSVSWNATHHELQQGGVGGDAGSLVREISAYYDVHVFRKVYLSGHDGAMSRFLVADNSTVPGQALEEFVRALFQRALLSSHTLAPDREDFDGWLDNLIDHVQPLYLDVRLYVDVFRNPDPEKAKQFGVETAFYLDDDPAVRAARALQQGKDVSSDDFDAATREDANRGGYGQALALGVQRLREASAFWRRVTDRLPKLKQ